MNPRRPHTGDPLRPGLASRAVTVVVAMFVTLLVAQGVQAATYPSPPPDFSHPGTNHSGFPFADLYNATGGQEDRPLLVIYARWTDVDYPSTFDATTVAQRFFGTGFPSTTFPSVGDYFRRLSFNDLFVFPAAETQGTPYDGVVQVTVPSTKAAFFALSPDARNKRLVELADPYVDYSSFDVDGNGSVSPLELVVNAYEAAPETPQWEGLGVTRALPSVSLDGVTLDGVHVAMTNTSTNWITIIHENAHALAGMPDLYGFGVGRLDLGGPTGRFSDMTLFAPSAWQKLHWGWITPTVVTRDGFYDVRRADTTGDAFILYDPDRGTDDYFIVENREQTFGTYDVGASDAGLVIWRIADSSLGVATGLRPIEPMVPDGSTTPTTNYTGSNRDAWNPADPATPQRTMSRSWADGTASNVAVRAIGAAGDVVRAYLDVRGPGVLVDTYPVDSGGPPRVTAGGEGQIDVPVMNTGETCDTFVFAPVQLPQGWTMGSAARILCAGETSFARVTIFPDANAAVGVHSIAIRGRSLTDASVVTESPLSVEVVLRATKLDLSGVAVTPTVATTTFQVRLSAGSDPLGQGVAGVPVTFTLAGTGGTLSLSAVTDGDGVAIATSPVTLPPGSYTLTIASERLGAFAASTTTEPYEVLSIEGTLQFVADTVTDLIAGAVSDGVRSALEDARDEIVGNGGGSSTNGALDRLADDDPVGAITKLRAASSQLMLAERRDAGDLTDAKRLLGLAAESIATVAYTDAKTAVGTPSPGQDRALQRIADQLLTGQGQLQAGTYTDACDSFRQATARALDLLR